MSRCHRAGRENCYPEIAKTGGIGRIRQKSKPMKYLVTGSTGFIGMALVRRLAAGGHDIHALVRSEKKAESIRHPNIRFFMGDVMDPAAIGEAIRGCGRVFHLAGLAKPVTGSPDAFIRVNAEGTHHLLEAAVKEGVERVVYTSTAGTYPPSGPHDDVDENSERQSSFFTDYARSKALAEEKCREFAGRGPEIVIVNPSRVYGPGLLTESNSVTRIIRAFRDGKWHIIPGDGKSYGNYVFIGDVVEGHLLAMEKGRPGESYLLGGENLTFDAFFKIISEETGRKPWLVHLPSVLLHMAAALLSGASRLAGKEPPITPQWVKRYLQHRRLSIRKAAGELGYQPIPFSEGVRRTLDWLNQTENSHG